MQLKRKKPGPKPTGIGPTIGLRLYTDMERDVSDWIARQPDELSRPEAIRRLIQRGLDMDSKPAAPAPSRRRKR
jgi:hypothetical protein